MGSATVDFFPWVPAIALAVAAIAFVSVMVWFQRSWVPYEGVPPPPPPMPWPPLQPDGALALTIGEFAEMGWRERQGLAVRGVLRTCPETRADLQAARQRVIAAARAWCATLYTEGAIENELSAACCALGALEESVPQVGL